MKKKYFLSYRYQFSLLISYFLFVQTVIIILFSFKAPLSDNYKNALLIIEGLVWLVPILGFMGPPSGMVRFTKEGFILYPFTIMRKRVIRYSDIHIFGFADQDIEWRGLTFLFFSTKPMDFSFNHRILRMKEKKYKDITLLQYNEKLFQAVLDNAPDDKIRKRWERSRNSYLHMHSGEL